MPKRNDLEQKALHYVVNTGYQGVLQSDLWRELGASSREGSRVSIKLEEKGLIRREKELQDGRWTYRLYPKGCLRRLKPSSIAHACYVQITHDATQQPLSHQKVAPD